MSDDDYRMQHRPPGPHYGAPLHALDSDEHGQFGSDVYDHPEYYGSGQTNREMVGAMRRAKGNPHAPITIYRALPKGHAHISTGDWVTTSAEYARQHGVHATDPDKDMPVVRATVPAKHLWTSGDELSEFGYHGPSVDAEIHHPGGKHAMRRLAEDDAPEDDSHLLKFHHEAWQSGGSLYPNEEKITAHHPDRGTVGHVHFLRGQKVNSPILIKMVRVEPGHRRRGYGSALANQLQTHYPKAKIKWGDFTDDGKAWWKNYGQGADRRGRTGSRCSLDRVGIRVGPDYHREDPETWGEDYHHYAGQYPHAAAVGQAQEHLRDAVPAYQHPLADSEEEASGSLQHMLGHVGHPLAGTSFVMRHPDPSKGISCTVRDHDGGPRVGVALHPDRWDYGTLAHEAAHLSHQHELGVGSGKWLSDEELHGPGFVEHFKRTLALVHKHAPDELHEAYHEALGRIRPQAARTANQHRRYRQTIQTSTGYEDQDRELQGPLYHGGRAKAGPGDHLTTGRRPNSWGDEGPKSTHNYFTTDMGTARAYAEDIGPKGRLYEVEPTGPIKSDYGPHDYKTEHPLRVVREVPQEEWMRKRASLSFEHHGPLEGNHHRLMAIDADDKPVGMLEYRQHPDGTVTHGEPSARAPEHAQALLGELGRLHPEARPRTVTAPVERPHAGPWYHGTTVPRVKQILPANKHRRGVTFPHDTDRDHAYATGDQDHAWNYAEKAWHSGNGGRPRVYEVEPMGHMEQDPTHTPEGRSRSVFPTDFRSRDGWRVMRELRMPKEMGRPSDWEDS